MKTYLIKCTNCDYEGDVTTVQPPYEEPEQMPCPKCAQKTLVRK